jgi:hypothetical protein
MTQRESKLFHNCKIVRKSPEEHNGKEVWTVTLGKEVFGGKWDLDITRVEPEVANRLERGQQYNLILERQNKKKADYSGDMDWMWYWGITAIADGDAAQQTETATTGAAPRQTAPTPSASLDERIAWNSAINNAVSKVPWTVEYPGREWLSEVDTLAQDLYALIRRGPLPPAEDAPPEPPEPPGEPTAEDVQYLADALDAQESSAKRRIIEI